MAFGDFVSGQVVQNTTSGSNPSLSLPSAPTAGNLLVAILTQDGTTGTITAASGWIGIGSMLSSTNRYMMAWKVVPSSDTASQTPFDTGGSTAAGAMIIAEYTGPVDTSSRESYDSDVDNDATKTIGGGVDPPDGVARLIVGGAGTDGNRTWSAQKVNGSTTGVAERGDIGGGTANAGYASTLFDLNQASTVSGSYTTEAVASVADSGGIFIAIFKQGASTGYKDSASRFQLAAQAFKDAASRFKLWVTGYRDAASRFKLQSVATYRDAATRFLLQAGETTAWRDAASRFNLWVLAYKDAASRFKLSVLAYRDSATRFKLWALTSRDAASRFKLWVPAYRDTASRFRLQALAYRDAASRFRVQSVTIFRDTATRLRLAALAYRDAATRFKLEALVTDAWRDAASRFRLWALAYRDAATRFRLQSAATYRDAATRFGLWVLAYRDSAARFRVAAGAWRDTATRFNLTAAAVDAWRDAATRFNLGLLGYRDAATRLRLAGLGFRDVAARFRVGTGLPEPAGVSVTAQPRGGLSLAATLVE